MMVRTDKGETLGDNDGFTLIELMIVIVITLILFAVAIPSIRQHGRSGKKLRPVVSAPLDNSRITTEMLKQQQQETARILKAVQTELRDEVR